MTSRNRGRNGNSDQWYQSQIHARVLQALSLDNHLEIPHDVPLEKTSAYKAEFRRQEKLFQKERKTVKAAEKELRRKKDEEGRAKDQARIEKDMQWGQLHAEDSDEQLVHYVRQIADRLGHTPSAQEVPGAAYIAQRFGSWAVVLTVAGLPLPKGMEPANSKTLKAYRERKTAETN